MNVTDSDTEAEFRSQVRNWLSSSLPASLRQIHTFAERVELDKLLAAGGYIGLTWPREYGGQGRSGVEASILDEEATLAGIEMAKSPSRIGQSMMAPALISHGTEPQRARFLPRVLRVEEIWCQGFSEPDAGSDLAAVRTAAHQQADGSFAITGTKLWTTQAQHADWCLLLARSDAEAPRHKNLTMLLLDMHQASITVSPIKQSNGDDEFNEVHFDGAIVPASQVLGTVGDGWNVAMTTLSSERSYSLRGKYILFSRQLARIAETIDAAGPAHPQRGGWLETLGRLHADVNAIRNLSYRFVSLLSASESTGSLGPISHLWWAATHQRLVEFGYQVAIGAGAQDLAYWYEAWLSSRAESIYGGTAQVQRNIISERVLGLPR